MLWFGQPSASARHSHTYEQKQTLPWACDVHVSSTDLFCRSKACIDGSDDESASRRKSLSKSMESSDRSSTSTQGYHSSASVPKLGKSDHLPIPGSSKDQFLSPGSSGLGLSPYVRSVGALFLVVPTVHYVEDLPLHVSLFARKVMTSLHKK